MTVVEVTDLRKSYGPLTAVDGVTFTVSAGEIFGVIGPNGAGKTTLLECVEGLRRPDNGSVRVLDLDPWRDGYAVRERIGIQLQSSAILDRLTVREALVLFGSFFRKTIPFDPLIDEMGLRDSARTAFANLSGGQKQRLFIALALLNDPEVVFLDELTTGLDPQARHVVWDLVRGMKTRGKTVVLTTHSMEEAAQLCDRLALIDRGRVHALDRPEALVRQLGAEQCVSFVAAEGFDPATLRGIAGVSRVERTDGRTFVYGRGDQLVAELVGSLGRQGVRFTDLKVTQPTLEDVFLALTGRELRE